MVCAASRLLLPAIVAGMIAATLTNQALVGWAVAVGVAALLYLAGRRRGASLNCALPPGTAARGHAASGAQVGHDSDLAGDPSSR